MNRADFLKQVAEDRILPTYLLVGEERLFHEELFRAAVAKLLSPADQEFNLVRLAAGDVQPESLVNHLEAGSFFGGARVVLLDHFEEGNAVLEETLLKSLNRLGDGVYLFISALKLDGRKKNHQELTKRLNTVDCAPVPANDLPLWVKQRSEKMGLKLTATQMRMICARAGEGLLRIRTELEKLQTYLGDRATLADSELAGLIPGDPEPDIFGLIDAVAQRNPQLGLPRLKEILDSGENEIKILATISRQFRNITGALAGRSAGMSAKALASALGINPYVAEKSFTQAARFKLDELSWIMERLVQADYRMKSGQREPRLELELAIVEICLHAR